MKKKRESTLKGILVLLFSQILIKIVGLLYKLYLTNREGFGDNGNAIYSSGFQIYALLLTFSSTGVPNAIAKLVSERIAIGDHKGAHRIFKISFFTFALFGIIGTILLFCSAKTIAVKWLQIPEAEYSLIALSPSIFFVSITSVIRGYFNGRQNLSATAKSQSIEQIFKTMFTVVLVELTVKVACINTTLMAAAANLATTMATITSFIYIYIYYRRERNEIAHEISVSVNYKVTRIRKTIKKILNESIPVSLSALMSSFNKNIDACTVVRILKQFMMESEAKAQYGILSGKIDVLCALPLSINVAFVTGMIPSITKSMAKNDIEEVKRKAKIFLIITFFIALLSTIALMVGAKLFLKILFPNASNGSLLLRINSIAVFFSVMAQTINGILQGIGKIRVPVIAFSIGVVFKLLCNILLIKNQYIGINGAAIGNIICNLIVCLIGLIIMLIEFKINLKKKKDFIENWRIS